MTDFQIKNTQVNGDVLLANLSVDASRAMTFQNSERQRIIVAATGAGTDIQLENLVQAQIGSLIVNSASPSGTTYINLGPDTADQASALLNVFRMSAVGDKRVLRFTLYASLSSTITLRNTSSTYAHVSLNNNTYQSGTLFNGTNSITSGYDAGNYPGLERLVVVTALNVTPGAEVIDFNILGRSM